MLIYQRVSTGPFLHSAPRCVLLCAKWVVQREGKKRCQSDSTVWKGARRIPDGNWERHTIPLWVCVLVEVLYNRGQHSWGYPATGMNRVTIMIPIPIHFWATCSGGYLKAQRTYQNGWVSGCLKICVLFFPNVLIVVGIGIGPTAWG